MTADVRSGCHGVSPLSARLEDWQRKVLDRPGRLAEWMEEHGSPINLIDPAPMARNAAELQTAASDHGLDLEIYFARKANKALALVDEAARLGLGVDLASERELAQALARGVPGKAMVMTAAVKPARLMEACVASGTTVVLDNVDEVDRLIALAERDRGGCPVALRLAPALGDDRLQTRFGFGIEEALATIDRSWGAEARHDLTIAGVHFHLDGYAAADRVAAIAQAIELVDALRERGHEPGFIDVGGGIPMSYLESEGEWKAFWRLHEAALLGEREQLTFEGHGLGLRVHGGRIQGAPAVYPYHQDPVRGQWLGAVLAASLPGGGETVAGALRDREVRLRCEPGRSLLDGCGMTAARVCHRKQRRDGTWLIGLEMNRTQCRSTSDDFMVDPLLVRPGAAAPGSEAIEGYFVGAYCIERELLTWRRMVLPDGVDVGDIVAFPNTGGYLMHILESSSHQIPLARNLIVAGDSDPVLDPIDLGHEPTGPEVAGPLT